LLPFYNIFDVVCDEVSGVAVGVFPFNQFFLNNTVILLMAYKLGGYFSWSSLMGTS
jgi:hypothetical protein